MPTVNQTSNQATLDSLRVIRRKLYSIPESELNAMSLEDQTSDGDNLHQTGLAILKLEAAKLKGVNAKFKKKEKELKTATVKLEGNLASLTDAVKVIRVAGKGLILVTNIIKLLA